ncbi:hypothetical protein [Pseudomonas serbica]|jgi:hypothetical protein|uniref:hypothetical protein n=1 Tax=Pseudomonas serbica TaxID=2965074 RepID=UPI00237BDB12|nr:hypothetical protein [Pseudomonas serbica]
MDLEQQIRKMAASGTSKAAAARVIGITTIKLNMICECIEGLQWKPKKSSASGVCPNESKDKWGSNLVKARAARKANLTRTVRGVTGTLNELCAHFNTAVTYSTVQRRVNGGMGLEEAMFSTSKMPVKAPKPVVHGYVRAGSSAVVEHRA